VYTLHYNPSFLSVRKQIFQIIKKTDTTMYKIKQDTDSERL